MPFRGQIDMISLCLWRYSNAWCCFMDHGVPALSPKHGPYPLCSLSLPYNPITLHIQGCGCRSSVGPCPGCCGKCGILGGHAQSFKGASNMAPFPNPEILSMKGLYWAHYWWRGLAVEAQLHPCSSPHASRKWSPDKTLLATLKPRCIAVT